ncbi:unnamed protein product, partial [Ectocarpus sp. 8 AP-2014]
DVGLDEREKRECSWTVWVRCGVGLDAVVVVVVVVTVVVTGRRRWPQQEAERRHSEGGVIMPCDIAGGRDDQGMEERRELDAGCREAGKVGRETELTGFCRGTFRRF